MVDVPTSRKIFVVVILILLLVLVFFLVKPFFSAILFGLILAYLLQWPYKQLLRVVKRPAISAAIICFLFVSLVSVGLYFLAQVTVKEAFDLYLNIGKIDILNLFNKIIGIFFSNSPEISRQFSISIQQTITSLVNSFVNSVGKIVLDAPKIFIQLFITILVAFYSLKESNKIVDYVKEILPFKTEINERFIKRSKDITFATIYGQIIVGLIQGITAGIGFYIFKAQSPLFLTLLAIFFAMLPILGAWVVWIPAAIAMIAAGQTTNGLLLVIYGALVVGTIDNIVRPFIVGKRGKINALVVFIGMVGGITFMGPVGLVIGPLALEYALIFIELYKTGNLTIK